MRTRFLVLLSMFYSVSACATGGRLGSIHPGMTLTDVMIELGKPMDIRVKDEASFWLYPSSSTEICTIKFIKNRVAPDAMKCDTTEKMPELASQTSGVLERMNSENEYKLRLLRYCGVRPIPEPGCRVSETCVNGEWEETCENSPQQKSPQP